MQPVYLVVPASGAGEMVAEFVDALAVDPVIAERVLLGVAEYSKFVNELSPLGHRWEDAARVTPSRFEGVSYAATFGGLAQLLDYDRYRLAENGVRIGRPLVIVVLAAAPSSDDAWRDGHLAIAGEDDQAAPVVSAVVTDPSAESFAAGIAYPTGRVSVVSAPMNAGKAAAAIVFKTFALAGSAF